MTTMTSTASTSTTDREHWHRLSTAFRRANPRCCVCGSDALQVVRLSPDPARQFDWSNLASSCYDCIQTLTCPAGR